MGALRTVVCAECYMAGMERVNAAGPILSRSGEWRDNKVRFGTKCGNQQRLKNCPVANCGHVMQAGNYSGPEVGLREMSCHGVLFDLPISAKPVSGSFPSGRRSGCYLLESDGQLDHFDGSMLIRTYRDLNKASGHLTHMRSPEAERNSPI